MTTRAGSPFKDGTSACFAAINHGKQSIALDLKAREDRAILEQLLLQADIVLETYHPGVTEKLGYGWDALRPACNMVVQARSGVMSITGESWREPVRVGASIGDIVAGVYLVQGVLAAVIDRAKTGEGRKIDVAMLDSQLALLEHAVAITTSTGTPPGPSGARHPSITPFQDVSRRRWPLCHRGGQRRALCPAARRAGPAARG